MTRIFYMCRCRQIRQPDPSAGIKNRGEAALSPCINQEQGISLSTAYKAYVQLEIKGLIEARPKSGYYVRYTPARSFDAPKREKPVNESEKLSLDEMIAMVHRNFSADSIVNYLLLHRHYPFAAG